MVSGAAIKDETAKPYLYGIRIKNCVEFKRVNFIEITNINY